MGAAPTSQPTTRPQKQERNLKQVIPATPEPSLDGFIQLDLKSDVGLAASAIAAASEAKRGDASAGKHMAKALDYAGQIKESELRDYALSSIVDKQIGIDDIKGAVTTIGLLKNPRTQVAKFAAAAKAQTTADDVKGAISTLDLAIGAAGKIENEALRKKFIEELTVNKKLLEAADKLPSKTPDRQPAKKA